ncbi:MAG: flavin reductase family protein [Clostridiales Family XIII bacterium]|jgi:flavin reductase (DIM6/NTAB) family NADH-FMN oxidoreductase RutF|nr:flavin reductase family protein [Clostridiales Family XIII bacterium]
MKKSIGSQPLAFPTPVYIVGTYDAEGQADMTAIAWAGIAASEPASVAISIRASRYSYENILREKAFTVNLPPQRYLAEADYFGIVSGRNADKLAATGLTAVPGEFVHAPILEEFPVALECVLTERLDLGTHTLFIGEIKDIKADEECLDEKGRVDWHALGILSYVPDSMEYLLPGEVAGKAFSAGKVFMK